MTDFISRTPHLDEVCASLRRYPVVALLGARQVGKTTLARQVAAFETAEAAYGPSVRDVLERATRALAEDPVYLARCFEALAVSPDARTLIRASL